MLYFSKRRFTDYVQQFANFVKFMHNLTVKFSGDSKREREKKKQHTERFSVVLLVVEVTLDFSDESPVIP
jgi:hypothetical protein